MNTYTLTVTIRVPAMHLFPAIIAVQDALKDTGQAFVEWDRFDPQSIADFEGAKRLLAPADEPECDDTHWAEDKYGNEYRVECSNGCEY
jgi:hypothetical protein